MDKLIKDVVRLRDEIKTLKKGIKNCPFCGSIPSFMDYKDEFRICCMECHIPLVLEADFDEAVKIWNGRR